MNGVIKATRITGATIGTTGAAITESEYVAFSIIATKLELWHEDFEGYSVGSHYCLLDRCLLDRCLLVLLLTVLLFSCQMYCRRLYD